MTPLDRVLRELGREHRATATPPDLGKALRQEFRRRQSASAWRWTRVAAYAAACLAAVAVAVWQWPAGERLELRVSAPAAPVVSVAARAQNPAPQARTRRAARPAPPQPEPEPREIATDFFPLRPGPVLEPGEVARVVRGRIPRRELLRFGLSGGEMMTAGGPPRDVPADVLFGADGTARAIRFVHVSNSVQGAQ
ncbi:MAG: hypothetical protein IT164_05515 [Bryobacterales bacterium]|nr:hypothetical protein [Bryobacterales bacterium]